MLTSCSADAAHGLLDKVEFFCSRPDFTDSVSGFASQHACAFAGEPIEGEHPLRWHELYLQYTALIEGQLEAFLREQGVPVAAMLSAATSDDTGAYTCIDYLVASTEYDAFLQLMYDFSAMRSWDVGADGAPGGCLEGEDLRYEGGTASAGSEPDVATE